MQTLVVEDFHCAGCSTKLVDTYIKCAECIGRLCLPCFGNGFESNSHSSNHSYEVVKADFPLFTSEWNVSEELELLDAVADLGFGNWSEVADQLEMKTARECEAHYSQCYLVRPQSPLPQMPPADIITMPPAIPFRASTDPPRPTEGSAAYSDMAGYSAARGDFAIEFNDFAELDLKEIDFTESDDEELDTSLKLAVVDVYRNVLRERHRRKLVIRKFGLINVNKSILHCRHYERVLGIRPMKCLKTLSKFFSPMQWDACLAALYLEHKLRQQISKLQSYRSEGLRFFHSVAVYKKLSARRQENKDKLHLLNNVLHCIQDDCKFRTWPQKKSVLDSLSSDLDISIPKPLRKSALPLDVSNLPGVDKLSEAEKQLCSSVRLVPELYLEFKQILVDECSKQGSLRLAQARTMIKIDVNKTRKLYDFLLEEKYICCNSNSKSLKKEAAKGTLQETFGEDQDL